MKNRYGSFIVVALCVMFASGAAGAADAVVPLVGQVDMSQAEYEAYRARIQRQIESGETRSGRTDGATDDKTEKPRESAGSGYGQGYRARQERSAGAGRMDAGRSGGANRVGGRNR